MCPVLNLCQHLRIVVLSDSNLDPAAAKHPTELQGQWLLQFRGATLTDPPREGNAQVGLPRSESPRIGILTRGLPVKGGVSSVHA